MAHLFILDQEGNQSEAEVEQPPATENSGQSLTSALGGSSPVNIVRGPRPPKRQKLSSDDDGGPRKFTCQICGNKFKEVLK